MRNILIELIYDGSGFHGWQKQNNARSVQEEVENALSRITGETVSVTGSSRTDAGVHALSYILNFYTNSEIPAEKFAPALSAQLNPQEIVAVRSEEVDEEFSARFSNDGKRYVYKIHNSRQRNPFLEKYSWYVPYVLDIEEMKKASKCFEGTHDFKGFMAVGGSQQTTVRTIRCCELYQEGDEIFIEVEADAFLYNMVRIITGTLVYVGCGKISALDMPDIIQSGERERAGMTAPPQGLYLKKVILK